MQPGRAVALHDESPGRAGRLGRCRFRGLAEVALAAVFLEGHAGSVPAGAGLRGERRPRLSWSTDPASVTVPVATRPRSAGSTHRSDAGHGSIGDARCGRRTAVLGPAQSAARTRLRNVRRRRHRCRQGSSVDLDQRMKRRRDVDLVARIPTSRRRVGSGGWVAREGHGRATGSAASAPAGRAARDPRSRAAAARGRSATPRGRRHRAPHRSTRNTLSVASPSRTRPAMAQFRDPPLQPPTKASRPSTAHSTLSPTWPHVRSSSTARPIRRPGWPRRRRGRPMPGTRSSPPRQPDPARPPARPAGHRRSRPARSSTAAERDERLQGHGAIDRVVPDDEARRRRDLDRGRAVAAAPCDHEAAPRKRSATCRGPDAARDRERSPSPAHRTTTAHGATSKGTRYASDQRRREDRGALRRAVRRRSRPTRSAAAARLSAPMVPASMNGTAGRRARRGRRTEARRAGDAAPRSRRRAARRRGAAGRRSRPEPKRRVEHPTRDRRDGPESSPQREPGDDQGRPTDDDGDAVERASDRPRGDEQAQGRDRFAEPLVILESRPRSPGRRGRSPALRRRRRGTGCRRWRPGWLGP